MNLEPITLVHSNYPEFKGKRIIIIAFLLSMVIHISIIMASPDIFLAKGFKTNLRAFKVDLIRLPMEKITDNSKKTPGPLTKIPTEPAKKNEEATISLDTTDSTYHPYAQLVKERIRQYWIYPSAARKDYIQGNLLIAFRLDRNGNLVESHIFRSSGYQILDGSALNAIESANPFPPFPETIPVQFLNINASFTYQLKFE